MPKATSIIFKLGVASNAVQISYMLKSSKQTRVYLKIHTTFQFEDTTRSAFKVYTILDEQDDHLFPG